MLDGEATEKDLLPPEMHALYQSPLMSSSLSINSVSPSLRYNTLHLASLSVLLMPAMTVLLASSPSFRGPGCHYIKNPDKNVQAVIFNVCKEIAANKLLRCCVPFLAFFASLQPA